MRFVKNNRKTKCKKCGKSELCFKDTLKKVNICPDCIDGYKKAKINCSHCKTSFHREDEYYTEEETVFKTKNFCSEKCYSRHLAEEKEKEEMIEWLKEYYKTDTLPSRIYMQMDDFKKKNNINYKWTFATLRYIVKIKGLDLQDGTIGIVPYSVDECKAHAKKINEIRKNAKESEHCRAKFTEEVVIIKTVDINKIRDSFIDKKTIRESDLEGVVLW